MLFGRSRPGQRVDGVCWLSAAVVGAAAAEAAVPVFVVIVAYFIVFGIEIDASQEE